jgi:N-ethylmaleimide reductase
MKTTAERKLFTPVQIGPITLKHRVVMAPLTRSRSQQPGDIPGDLMLEYYTQRASDGGFIISGGDDHLDHGSRMVRSARSLFGPTSGRMEEDHSRCPRERRYMFSQLWHTGRSSHFEMTGGPAPVSASVNPSYWGDASHVTSAPSGWIRPSPH